MVCTVTSLRQYCCVMWLHEALSTGPFQRAQTRVQCEFACSRDGNLALGMQEVIGSQSQRVLWGVNARQCDVCIVQR